MVIYYVFFVLFYLFKIIQSKITIHVIPHSHQNIGRLNTFDEYYYKNAYDILTNSIESLLINNNRTFTYADISFFKQWYISLNETTKVHLHSLIKERRFCFVNGGFGLESETLSNYNDVINELRIGLEFLQNELNITIKIGWFLDQIVHSDSNAYIYKQFGFKYFILNRLSSVTKTNLYNECNLELYWKPLFIEDEIFTHVIYDYFVPPKPLKKFVNDKKLNLTLNEIEQISNDFFTIVEKAVKGYRHNHYILYYGNDFVLTEPNINYENIEMIMEYMNKHMSKKVEIKYSTPQRYFKEIKTLLKDQKHNMLKYYGDFMPLGDISIWNGYYASRPILRGKIRESNIFSNIINKLVFDYFLSKTTSQSESSLFYKEQLSLQETVTLNKYHYTITNDSQTNVNNDYFDMLNKGEVNIKKYIITKTLPEIFECDNEMNVNNISICLSNNKVNLGCNVSIYDNNGYNKTQWYTIYNPGINEDVLITMEFNYTTSLVNNTFEIKDHMSNILLYDIYCIPNHTCLIYFFYNVDISLSFVSFSIKNITSKSINNMNNTKVMLNAVNEIKMFNNSVHYNVSKNAFKINKNDYDLSLIHGYLVSASSNETYIQNQKYETINKFQINLNHSFYYEGKISNGILLRTTNTSLLIILFKEPFFVQTVSVLEPIQQPYPKSFNFLLIVESNIINNGTFYTDSSGMNSVKRTTHQQNKITGSDFYPICSNVIIESEIKTTSSKRLTIYNDRLEGATSFQNGSVMLVINYFTKLDDNKRLNSKLYEPQSTNQSFMLKHIIAFDFNNKTHNNLIHQLAENYFNEGFLLFTSSNNIFHNNNKIISSKINDIFYYPSNIKMNIIYIDSNRTIVQFFNTFDKFIYDSSSLSLNNFITISLNNINFTLKQCLVNGFNCKDIINNTKSIKHNLRKHHYSNYINYIIKPFQFKVFEISFNI